LYDLLLKATECIAFAVGGLETISLLIITALSGATVADKKYY
jgi:hypothetical protein